MRKLAGLILAFITPLTLLAQQTVTLNDGTQFHGKLVRAENQTVVFQDTNGDRHRFDFSEVQSVSFDGNQNQNSASSSSGGNYAASEADQSRRPDRDRVNVYATLPGGTELAVRTNESVNSNGATEGRVWQAQLERDVTDPSGNVILPKGSPAQLVVRDVSRDGTAAEPRMVLDLQSIRVNGQSYAMNTQDVQRGNQGLRQNRRAREYVGGGAVPGTLLGVAAGGGVEVLNKGNEVRVPAETVLTFRLDQPVTLSPQ